MDAVLLRPGQSEEPEGSSEGRFGLRGSLGAGQS